ncbi:tyrosine-type recombinase/integrase [Acanthopleuribacter pedis]|uniref:Tyrosine-type recombinase/integrase n=1 Tax=Acanthopleuribacter pedis TaxID=442870 RepID=A0A8J7QBF5_9BACT|nr:tyrosine-type recombinase/integrase [Acanthopleuribacter pedis]MBO1322486.1 tyrosine-type recombinase/integrase [Acanthopleuribacter pedis]
MNSFLKYSDISSLDGMNRIQIKHFIMEHGNKKKWSPKTTRNYLQTLSLFCDWLVAEEFISVNPVKTIQKPRLQKSVRSFLSVEQAEDLLECARVFPGKSKFERLRAYAILATFLFTGIRKSELLNLKIEHILFDREDILIQKGKGQKDRLLPMIPRLVDILTLYFKVREQEGYTTSFFFPALRTNSRLGSKSLQRMVNILKEQSGINFYPHLLRHTFATQLLSQGVTLPDVSFFLGHANVQSTLPYLHSAVNPYRTTIRKLPFAHR